MSRRGDADVPDFKIPDTDESVFITVVFRMPKLPDVKHEAVEDDDERAEQAEQIQRAYKNFVYNAIGQQCVRKSLLKADAVEKNVEILSSDVVMGDTTKRAILASVNLLHFDRTGLTQLLTGLAFIVYIC